MLQSKEKKKCIIFYIIFLFIHNKVGVGCYTKTVDKKTKAYIPYTYLKP